MKTFEQATQVLYDTRKQERCNHTVGKHSIVKEINCTVVEIEVICDQCDQVIKTQIET